MHSLYDDAELYDLVSPPDAGMERFYVEAAGGPGQQVLELACGTGRITAPLAASGAIVIGGDLSETMLERAGRLLAERGLTAALLQLDMRDFSLDQRFDAVVIAANSLLHLHSHEDFAQAFAAIRRHLKPGGRLCFDVFVPSVRLLSTPPGERKLLGRFRHEKLGEVTVVETLDYDPASQLLRADWYWSEPDWPDFRHTPLTLRQIFPQELPLLLQLGGLRLDQRFGGFDRSALTADSGRQVCIAGAA